MAKNSITLSGLDASNPLAFMAALGTLQSLMDSGTDAGQDAPWCLSWRDEGRWVAVLHGCSDADAVIKRLIVEKESWRDELALQLVYDKEGMRLPADRDQGVCDLKPDPASFRVFVEEVAQASTSAQQRSVRQVAAYGSELATDNNGRLKPTALHFTAGQQTFLGMVRSLQQRVSKDDLREALIGPWRNLSELPNLSWNASAPRIYAYRSSNPSGGDKRGSVPGADWLAFVGLRFFPVAAKRSRLQTTAVEGGWKNSTMVWPVWTSPLGLHAIRSLLGWRGLRDPDAREERSAAGIVALYESRIQRSDQGGYGSFSPARVL